MKFYEITTDHGRFFIEADRVSSAFRIARAILGDDEFTLTGAPDLQFVA